MIISTVSEEARFSPDLLSMRFDLFGIHAPLGTTTTVSVTNDSRTSEVEIAIGGFARENSIDHDMDSLRKSAQRSVDRFPSSARAHANLGLALLKIGSVDSAINELKIALEIDARNYAANLGLARALAVQGDVASSAEVYRRILEQVPSSLPALVSLCYFAMKDGDFSTARVYAEKATSLPAPTADAYFLAGLANLKMRKANEAIRHFREATHRDIRNASFHHALAVAYSLAGDNSRAERALRTALSLNPQSRRIAIALGNLLVKSDRSEEALGLLRELSERHPKDLTVLELYADVLMGLQRFSDARAQLLKALSLPEESLDKINKSRLLNNMAVTFLAERLNRQGEERLIAAINMAPSDSSVPYQNLSKLRFASGKDLEALAVLNDAKLRFPHDQECARLRGQTLARLNQNNLAIAELRSFVEAGTADAKTYSALGGLYTWEADYTSSIDVLTTANAKFPGQSSILNNLIYSLLMMGRVVEARKLVRQIRKNDEANHVELTATMGLLRLWEGDLVDGTELYERAEELARNEGNKDLAQRVRQKMHLERAKFFHRGGRPMDAIAEIKGGLAMKVMDKRHIEDLNLLRDEVSGTIA